MKKKLIWIGLFIIVILFIAAYLYSQGIIKTNWQWLSMILAGIAAPFELIYNWISGKNTQVDKIVNAQKTRIQNEQNHRIVYDQAIIEKEQKIKDLQVKVNVLEDKVDSLNMQKKLVDDNVNKMTDINDLQDAFMEAYGDEK